MSSRADGLAERHAVADAAWGDGEPEPRPWSSGPWSLEVRGDELADLAVDGTVVLRAIKAVIRDRDWGTVPSQAVAVTVGVDALEVELRFSGLGGEFSGMLRAEVLPSDGAAEGRALRVTTELLALVPFERNRAGLVLLLPADAAGSALRVRHADGSSDQLALPEQIAPHQPAVDIAALEWTHDGISSELAFEGDTFEMEDQRNWTDASFKVYSTPLSLPFPVALAAGATVRQGLELHAERVEAAAAPTPLAPLELRPAGRAVPAIGTSASTGPDPVETTVVDPGTLLVELDLAAANWRPLLIRAATEAGDAALDVRLISDDPAVIASAVAELAPLAPARLGVFSAVTHVTEEAGWRALTAAVVAAGLDAELVGGTRAHFTELNRNHARLPAELPALSYSSTPQMHARERAQLVESIAMQRLTARDAVRIAAGRPVHLGPVTLRGRFNAVATTPPPPEPPDLGHGSGPAHLEGATDPRQSSPALAAWLVASAAANSITGVASLSFFEASGPRGIAGNPVATAFAWLRELSGHPLLEPDHELPTGLWMLAAHAPAGPIALVANLNSEPVSLTVTLESRTVELTLEPLTARRVALGPVEAHGEAHGEAHAEAHGEEHGEADSR